MVYFNVFWTRPRECYDQSEWRNTCELLVEALQLDFKVRIYALAERLSEGVFSHYSDYIKRLIQKNAHAFHGVGLAVTPQIAPTRTIQQVTRATPAVADLKKLSLGQLF